jgi:nitrite reductase/ring-hydroxylating ferredoxin subunit
VVLGLEHLPWGLGFPGAPQALHGAEGEHPEADEDAAHEQEHQQGHAKQGEADAQQWIAGARGTKAVQSSENSGHVRNATLGRAPSMEAGMGQGVSEALIEPAAVPEGALVALDLEIGPERVAVLALRRGETLQLWHNACPHAGRRLDYAPGRFLMHEGRLVCAAHGAQFSLEDGACVDGPGRGGRLAPLEVSRVEPGWRVRLTAA